MGKSKRRLEVVVNEQGEVIGSNHEELIKRKKRRKRRRKIMLTFVLLIIVTVTLMLELETFNIAEIEVAGNNNLTEEELIELSGIHTGENIFSTGMSEARKNIDKDVYIKNVTVERELPGTVNIEVEEREAMFYYNDTQNYYIIADDLTLLERSSELENKELIYVNLKEASSTGIGRKVEGEDVRVEYVLNTFSEFNKVYDGIESIDLRDLSEISFYVNSLEIRVGDSDRLREKINVAISIVDEMHLEEAKGYLDVSLESNAILNVK